MGRPPMDATEVTIRIIAAFAVGVVLGILGGLIVGTVVLGSLGLGVLLGVILAAVVGYATWSASFQ